MGRETNPHEGYKYLPVVDQDACTGCATCVDACDHGCLHMAWAYATLIRPHDCGSEGVCEAACPEDAIRMEWVGMQQRGERGQWRVDQPHEAIAEPSTWWGAIKRVLNR